MKREAILMCVQKPAWARLMYSREPTTKKYKRICSEVTVKVWGIMQSVLKKNKKLSYRRGTARCVVLVEICQFQRNSAETTYTTSPDQIDGMKLEI